MPAARLLDLKYLISVAVFLLLLLFSTLISNVKSGSLHTGSVYFKF